LCNAVARQGGFALYLPLRELKDFDPADIFDNAEMVECLCVDDIDAVMGLPAWEEALFHLYNNRRQIQKTTVFSASVIVNELTIALPDLRTRLTACLCFQIPLLSDEQKVALVQWRAKSVGMELNDACATFVIQRSGRQLEDLLAVMNRLEKESLIAGRKITIPFIKSVLQW
jgi:DnaA family protein